MLLDGERVGHRFYIEVVGTDEREGLALLLQFLNHRANHLQRPLLRTVLLAVGDDGHQYVVAIFNLSVDLRDTLADCIVKGSAAAGIVSPPTEIFCTRGWSIVVVPGGVAAVEGQQGDGLLLVGEFLLHLADGLQRLVHAGEGLLADDGHRTALVNDNQVVNSLNFCIILSHNLEFLFVNTLFSTSLYLLEDGFRKKLSYYEDLFVNLHPDRVRACSRSAEAFKDMSYAKASVMKQKRTTPEFITSLQPNEIFVFGSNLKGMHGGGAAYIAYRKFGAIMGQGVGLQGQSYAIPTMQGGVETIKPYVDEFIEFAKQHPELTFLVTRIGCGIAGFTDDEIAPLFADAHDVENIVLPPNW